MRRGPSRLNCIFAIDKPQGMTSHDVVSHVRRALGERRVGHAGTLDPAATGVLVVGVGQATRLLGLLTAERKSYEGTVSFGCQTTTDDAEGQVVRRAPIPATLEVAGVAQDLLASLLGPQDQEPPAYSAISVGGRRAYDLARSGQEVRLESRPIEVFEASLLGMAGSAPTGDLSWRCRFVVSKGTYVRSLARDLGLAAGTVAHLSQLRRTSSGVIGLGDCLALDDLERDGLGALGGKVLDPALLLGASVVQLTDREAEDAACGRRLRAPRGLASGQRVCLVHGGKMVGLWRAEGPLLVCQVNFPQSIEGVGL